MRKMTWLNLRWYVAATVLLACGQANSGVNFNDFSSTAGLQLNGNAAQAGGALRIVPSLVGQAGSAFTTSKQNVAAFSTSFKFQIRNSGGVFDVSGQNGADGLTFTIQNNVPTALGGGGGGLGYSGMPNSVAVEFDTWNNDPMNFPDVSDPDSNHVGVDIGGSVNSAVTVAVAPQFDDTTIWYAWIDYNGTTLEVRTNNTVIRPALPNISIPINIPAVVGSTNAFIGFTGGTGGAFGDHDLLCWNFNCPPDCSGASPSLTTLWPPNHKFVPIAIMGVTDPDGDLVTINIDSIFQDEPVSFADAPPDIKGTGSGKTAPDATGVGTSIASVRAERNGNPNTPGDGRVYRIRFTASDGKPGGTCSGEVTVCVPHDQSDETCIQGAFDFDSTFEP